MTVMKYTTEADVDYGGDYSPEGERISGFVTQALTSDFFGEAVRCLVLKETNRTYGRPSILMTTRAHWSGYSEFTITNQWSEIALSVVDWNWEREWPSLGDFLRAVAEANPQAEDYYGPKWS